MKEHLDFWFLSVLWTKKTQKWSTAFLCKVYSNKYSDDKSLIHIAGMVHYLLSKIQYCILQLLLQWTFTISFDGTLKCEYWAQA